MEMPNKKVSVHTVTLSLIEIFCLLMTDLQSLVAGFDDLYCHACLENVLNHLLLPSPLLGPLTKGRTASCLGKVITGPKFIQGRARATGSPLSEESQAMMPHVPRGLARSRMGGTGIPLAPT
jgi:hypothetical protein